MHVIYPPKFYITIVFNFSWDDCNTQEKLETIVMHFFVVGKGGGGSCIIVYVKMGNYQV